MSLSTMHINVSIPNYTLHSRSRHLFLNNDGNVQKNPLSLNVYSSTFLIPGPSTLNWIQTKIYWVLQPMPCPSTKKLNTLLSLCLQPRLDFVLWDLYLIYQIFLLYAHFTLACFKYYPLYDKCFPWITSSKICLMTCIFSSWKRGAKELYNHHVDLI